MKTLTRMCVSCNQPFVITRRQGARQACSQRCYLQAILDRIDDKANCWAWPLSRNRNGYGQASNRWGPGPKMRLAPRAIFESFVGAIPEGMCVLHKCDNPACVRPDHLFLGSMKDNTQDMMAKGRNRFVVRSGDEHWTRKRRADTCS